MTNHDGNAKLRSVRNGFPNPMSRNQMISCFALAVLGFSFWFFMALPFASHRETYGWLAGVPSQSFCHQFSVGLSSTYRPLAQAVTYIGFVILNPHVFPTSVLRQTMIQVCIYGMFVLAWWFIFSAAPQQRLFAFIACVAGGVFFSGYVHLFHVYGLFYVPVVLTLGALLRFRATNTFAEHEVWFALVAVVLAFWHPFATALFLGFFFGFYLETFQHRSKSEHVRAITILLIAMMAIMMLVVVFPRAHAALDTKLFGFLVSYETNEINVVASIVAFLLTEMAVFSMGLSRKLTVFASSVVLGLSALFFVKGLPLLLLWICLTMIKLIQMRLWSLASLTLTAALLPIGGGIGTPIYALFVIILAAYATALGWSRADAALSFVTPREMAGIVVIAVVLIGIVRAGLYIPVITKGAQPLLAERERTYQLESSLAWLHSSDYCGYDVSFLDKAGSPIDDVQSAITRRNRPPADLADVQLFWRTVLRCHDTRGNIGTAVVTFGDSTVPNSTAVLRLRGAYAGEAAVWISDRQASALRSSIHN